MSANTLRLYVPGVDEFGTDGYPLAWHATVKHTIRALAGERCERCGHPYRRGEHGSGEWTPCDERCTHRGPARLLYLSGDGGRVEIPNHQLATEAGVVVGYGKHVEARWRILTVHHLDGEKANCRWWNLAALCQRCHLTIQGKVVMERVWPHEHSPWFRPHAAGWYAYRYLGEDVTREQAIERMEELLALEVRQLALEAARV